MTSIRFDTHTLSLVLDGLPDLQGSDKQIAWASDIRSGLFDRQICQRFDNLRAKAPVDKVAGMIDATVATLNRTLAPLFDRTTSAKTWIDNRNGDLQIMVRSL